MLGELTKTNFKTEDNNEPPLEAVENMIDLCENWLEDLRYSYNMLYGGDHNRGTVLPVATEEPSLC